MAAGNKVFAYLVIDALIEPIDSLLEIPAEYKTPIESGEIMIRRESFGKGTCTVTEEDGPVKITLTGQFVGEGIEAGDKINFSLGVQRLLNLLSIGLRNEVVLRDQIHEFADKTKEKLEGLMSKGMHDDLLGNQLREIDKLEKTFFDRKSR